MDGMDRGKTYIGLISISTVVIVLYHALHPDPYIPGDWLINYTAGFVRRGLAGEILILLARALHLPVVILGSLLPLLFYGILYLFLWQLWKPNGLWAFIALISPATLAFPILSAGGASHKETVLLALLAGLLVWNRSRKPSDAALSMYSVCAVVAILLCHEGLAPYLIYFSIALWLATGDIRRTAYILVVPVVAGIATLYAVRHHIGDGEIERRICQSLNTRNPEICSGAIAYLARVPADAHQDVVASIRDFHYWFYYPLLGCLAVAPLIGMWAGLKPQHRRVFLLCIPCAYLASVPIFYYGADWGRWIYIHVMCSFLLLLSVSKSETSGAPQRIKIKSLAFTAVIVYATCWNMPYGGDNVKKGYWNIPLHMLKAHTLSQTRSGK